MGRAFLAVQGSQAVSWSKMSAAFSRERSYFWLRMRSTRLRLLARMGLGLAFGLGLADPSPNPNPNSIPVPIPIPIPIPNPSPSLLAWMVFLSAAISSSVSGALGRLRPGGVGLAGGRPSARRSALLSCLGSGSGPEAGVGGGGAAEATAVLAAQSAAAADFMDARLEGGGR